MLKAMPRRILLELVALVALCHRVRAEALGHVHGVRHWHDIVGRCGLQLIDKIDNAGELFDHIVDVLLVQAKPCKQRDVLYLFFTQRHCEFQTVNRVAGDWRPPQGIIASDPCGAAIIHTALLKVVRIARLRG